MPNNYLVTQLRLLDVSHQDKGINKVNTNITCLHSFISDLREHGIDVSDMYTVHKGYQGIQYRLEAQKEAISQLKSTALQTNSLLNLPDQYNMLYQRALHNQPSFEDVTSTGHGPASEDREQQLQEELETEGVVVQSQTESLICPITQQRMVYPMVNKQCGHSYDKNAINQHIRHSRALTVKCPVGGCAGKVNQAYLSPDTRLAALLHQ